MQKILMHRCATVDGSYSYHSYVRNSTVKSFFDITPRQKINTPLAPQNSPQTRLRQQNHHPTTRETPKPLFSFPAKKKKPRIHPQGYHTARKEGKKIHQRRIHSISSPANSQPRAGGFVSPPPLLRICARQQQHSFESERKYIYYYRGVASLYSLARPKMQAACVASRGRRWECAARRAPNGKSTTPARLGLRTLMYTL